MSKWRAWAGAGIVCAACSPAAPSATNAAHGPARVGAGAPSSSASASVSSVSSACIPAPAPTVAPPGEDAPWVPDELASMAEPYDDDVCGVADSNIARAEAAVLALRSPPAVTERRRWNPKSDPARFAQVAERFTLTAAERTALRTHGFVVPERLTSTGWSEAYHEVYQSELPLFVSTDSILHAIYASNDKLIEAIEDGKLIGLAERLLTAMACELPTAAASYPVEVARDLDLYLTVARSLLADAKVPSSMGTDAEAAALVELAKQASGMEHVTLFGRPRVIDFSQYLPRGHYAGSDRMKAYFRAAMWLSRLEFNLVSRSSRSSADAAIADPRPTPREATAALALADLAERAGVDADIVTFDQVFGLLAGRREDVSLHELNEIRHRVGIKSFAIPEASDRLTAAIGESHQRTARLHPMPEGSTVLPAITTLLGPRVTADTFATRPLVHGEVMDRHLPRAGDIAFALGHDRAKRLLAEDLARYPSLETGLARARTILTPPYAGEDLYGAWLGALHAVSERPAGALPSFMETDAYADLRVGTAVAGFGQLRHNFVLIVGQGYDEGGCEIPDAYVEPAPAVYDGLLAYARRGATVMKLVDPTDETKAQAYFEQLAKTLRTLRTIVDWELTGAPLPPEALRFLAMVVELRPYGGTGGPPTFTGWYFDLFRKRSEGLSPPSFIADWATSGYEGKVAYVGARAPRLGIFVVDAGGPPRVMVGPVAHAFEAVGPIGKRRTDADVRTSAPVAGESSPWESSYVVPSLPEPPLLVTTTFSNDPKRMATGKSGAFVVSAKSTRALGPVTVELLDHHRRVLGSITHPVGTRDTAFAFVPPPIKRPAKPTDTPEPTLGERVDAVRVRVGAFSHVEARPHQSWADEDVLTMTLALGGMPGTTAATPAP